MSDRTNHENAIILGRVGAYCGSVAICHDEFWASDNTIVVKPRHGNSLRYIYYRLLGMALRHYAGGAAQPLLTHSILRVVRLAMHDDFGEQRRIADILSAYDDLIENNRRRIALLEQAARELYREWFVRLRFPGHDENTRIVDGVPEGWQRVRLSDLVSTQYGYTASANEEPIGPKFLRGTDINKNSYIDWDTVPYCPTSDLNIGKYALRTGDLLVVRMADPGKVAIVERQIQAVFASYLVRLVIHNDSRTFPLYLFYVLTDSEYQGFIGAASGGSTRTAPDVRGGGGMNRADAAGLLAVGEGITTEFMRSGHVGARAGDARMRQRGRRDESARSEGRWRGGRDGRSGRKIPVRMTETR